MFIDCILALTKSKRGKKRKR